MSAHDPSFDFAAALEAQAPFLSRLARSLITDEHAAADAVQDTLLSAWKAGSARPPAQAETEYQSPAGLEGGRLRAWLAAALWRKSVSRLRSAALFYERQEPENQAGNAEALSDATGDLAADTVSAPERVAVRLERQALLHEAVQSLPEAYRTTIVLHFQDSMSAREIADELRLPVATIRSRIQRGLLKLRSELDRHQEASGEANPRASWLAALTPLAFPESKSAAIVPSTAAASVAGLISVLVMNKIVLACLGVLAAAGATFLYQTSSVGVIPTIEVAGGAERSLGEPLMAVQPDLAELDQPGSTRLEVSQSPMASSEQAGSQPSSTHATITGRAMLMDGTALAGVEVSARRDLTLGAPPIAVTQTDESGAFTLSISSLESVDPVTVLVSREFDIPNGAVIENVQPGAANLEFRIDALVVRVFPDDMSQLSTGAHGAKRDALLKVSSSDPGSVTGGFLPFKYHTSTEKASCRLLRPGFEYLFTATLGEFGADQWTAVVPAGLRSGVYEFQLKKHHQALATYTAHLTGEPLGEDQRLWIALMQETNAEGHEVNGQAHGAAHFSGSETTITRDNCLPGTSFVSANLSSRREPGYLYVTNQHQTVQMTADQNTEFSIDLARGGRFSVHAVRADGETPEAPLQGGIYYTYVRGGPSGEIGTPNVMGQLKQSGKRGRWAMTPFVELGETFLSQDAIHPGTIEVELNCRGYEKNQSTLEIVPGETTDWRVELVPKNSPTTSGRSEAKGESQ